VCAWDEDSTTLALDAARLALGDGVEVSSITVVSRSQSYLLDDAQVVIARALRLDDTVRVTQIQGAGCDALLALAAAGPGDLIIAVDSVGAVGAAAILVSGDPGVRVLAQRRHSLPARTRAAGDAETATYDDARLMRERGWRPAVDALRGEGEVAVTGLPRSVATRLGATYPDSFEDPTEPSWAALSAAAALAGGPGGRLIATDGASAVAVEIVPTTTEIRRGPRAPHEAVAVVAGAGIPLSLAAYERAFDAKVGLYAGRCVCGESFFPPRRYCPACGRADEMETVELARSGSVYTVATIRTPVPGMPREYSLAIVDIDGADVRALVHVTGAPPGSAAIGDHGKLVLRRIAEREGVPDYGFAFLNEAAK